MATFGNLAARVDLKLVRGTDASITINVTEDGEVKPLTGYSASLLIKPKENSPTLLDELTTENGRITIDTVLGALILSFTTAETDPSWTKAIYTLDLIDADDVITRLIDGDFTYLFRSSASDQPTASVTVETANQLTLDILPFDTTRANAIAIYGAAVSSTPPVAGAMLRASSTTGVAWSTVTYTDSYAQGGIPYASAANVISALPIGASNRVLTSNGSAPQWSSSLSLGGALAVTGTTSGAVAVSGDHYSHCLVSVGFNNDANPLNELHQVAFYAPLLGNSYARGAGSFVCGFESGTGTSTAAGALEVCAGFSAGDMSVSGTSTIGRTINYIFNDAEATGTAGNAAFAQFSTMTSFTGNWLIYYTGSRPSNLGTGDLTVGAELYRGVRDDFVRISSGNAGGDGVNILMFGPTHATNANKMQINASGGVTLTGALTIAGDFIGGAEYYRAVNTSYSRFFGGTLGDGATMLLFGGAHATTPNQAQLSASGGFAITGAVTMTSTLQVTGAITIGASQDLNLPGGGFGIQNAQTRFLAVGTGTAPSLTWVGKHITAASTTIQAGMNLPHGTAPSAPVDGDHWTTSAGAFYRINGVTKTVTLT